MEKEIFGLELTEEGIYWLAKFRSLAVVVLATTIIFHGLFVYTTVPLVIRANHGNFLSPKLSLMNSLFLVNLIVNFILQVAQVIFYYRFAASCNVAIEAKDQAAFNTSFKWLYRQAMASAVLFSISIVHFLYSYFTRPI